MNNKDNINIIASTIINIGNSEKGTFQKYVRINDIIGKKCELNLVILNLFFENYDHSQTSKNSIGPIKSYGVNTYQDIVCNYNEDKISIIINMNKLKNFLKKLRKFIFLEFMMDMGGRILRISRR